MTSMVAVDLGAQSGRVAVGHLDGDSLSVTDVHRFANVPVQVQGTLHWDALRLWNDLLDGVAEARRAAASDVKSLGVDTWGLDFALLDRAGRLLSNSVHHRDRRTEGVIEEAAPLMSARDLYEGTGTELLPVNALWQLRSMVMASDPALDNAARLLMIPDRFHYWLSGAPACEFTVATTSGCLDSRRGSWAVDVLDRFGIPSRLFAEIVQPGTVLGHLRGEALERTGLRATQVVTPASHDTASAVAAVPFRQPGSVLISCGTWSLVGMELPSPLIDDRTFAVNLTNEGGAGGRFRLLKNVTGLWLLHECRRTWAREGQTWGYDDLIDMAATAAPLRAVLDPSAPQFTAPGDMPAVIRSYWARTGQMVPNTAGAVVRCVLESLALKHRQSIDLPRTAAGATPAEVHVVVVGSLNRLLCQWTADATGLPVLAGPVEAAETFVHVLGLGLAGVRYVAHTHPSALTGLLSSSAAASVLVAGPLFPDEGVVCGAAPLYVPYADPGLKLARVMAPRLREYLEARGEPPRVIYLANHGLVAMGSSAAEAEAVTTMAVKAARVRVAALLSGELQPLPDASVEALSRREDEMARRARLNGETP